MVGLDQTPEAFLREAAPGGDKSQIKIHRGAGTLGAMADLQGYLDRIGFEGEARPDRATLDAGAPPSPAGGELRNLDVQLGEPLVTDRQQAFAKVVDRRRGGWCYEMNGSLGHALDLIGFKVTRMAGGVMRSAGGDAGGQQHTRYCASTTCPAGL